MSLNEAEVEVIGGRGISLGTAMVIQCDAIGIIIAADNKDSCR